MRLMEKTLEAIGEKELGVVCIEAPTARISTTGKYVERLLRKFFDPAVLECIVVDTLAPRETVHPDAHEIQREAMGHVTAYPHVMLIAQENVHVRINGATPQEVVDEVRSLARRLGVAELDSGKL